MATVDVIVPCYNYGRFLRECVGRVLARTARTPQSKRTRQIVCFSLATIAMIAATPWPGTAHGRPWFRV